jgi:hypothetical protein
VRGNDFFNRTSKAQETKANIDMWVYIELNFCASKDNWLCVVAHACNLSTRRLRQEGIEVKVSLGYIVRPYLKKERGDKIKCEKATYGITRQPTE